MSTPIDHTRRVFERKKSSGRISNEAIVVPSETISELKKALEAEIAGEVRFSSADRALYATDASNYRQIPFGVVLPKCADDVIATVRLCNHFDVPVTPRGGGTALAGQTCNSAVIIDFSKYMHRVLSIDAAAKTAVVEPGCILDDLRDEAEKYGLTFGPDPATHDHNTLGGMIGNDSCGVHSVMAGRTADNVQSLDVLTYDGLRMKVGRTSPHALTEIQRAGGRAAEIYTAMVSFWKTNGKHFERVYPDIPRRVSGYENLDQLAPEKKMNVARALTGTEATCVIILSAELKLVESPRHRVLAIVGFPDVFLAADDVPEVLTTCPIGLEGIDHLLIEYMKRKNFRVADLEILPEGRAWLISEFGADTSEQAEAMAQKLLDLMREKGRAGKLVSDKETQHKVWEVREAALAVTAHVPGMGATWPGWEDSAVHPKDLGKYLRELKELFHAHGYEASVYGHFGDGLVHCRVDFDLHTEQGIANWQRFLQEAADLVVKYDGSLSGEHGDGEARAALLEKMYGPELMAAQREFRAIWDRRERMNPGKVLDAYPITANLRVGPDYRPVKVESSFSLPEDGGSFTTATLRCVGVGKCRRRHVSGDVMCPSYLGTDEEKHSTRGRARLLFEMLRGDSIGGGFANADVEDSLSLCLACKGCKRDCPVSVDMATYKSEFRSRHYRERWRPRAAYSMGQIHRWAALVSNFPRAANSAMDVPAVARMAKRMGGISQMRVLPHFAAQTFRSWHGGRPAKQNGERVILWPDTFNNYFRPKTAIAATQLLERQGLRVDIPTVDLCCARPLYDWGWLDQAKTLWRRTLDALRQDIEDGVKVIGLEPACTSAFRDELPALFPNDDHARALSKQTFFLTEFLNARGFEPGATSEPPSEAVAQLHCHHHAVLDEAAERSILKKLPFECKVLGKGCCGMAGSFGFEADKFDLSMRIAEKGILPVIRTTSDEALIIANGFSCREQIEQGTQRRTSHIAEILEGLSREPA